MQASRGKKEAMVKSVCICEQMQGVVLGAHRIWHRFFSFRQIFQRILTKTKQWKQQVGFSTSCRVISSNSVGTVVSFVTGHNKFCDRTQQPNVRPKFGLNLHHYGLRAGKNRPSFLDHLPKARSHSHKMHSRNAAHVRLIDRGNHVVLDNNMIQVTLSKPGGLVLCLCYGGIDNVLETRNRETNRGYWDLNWNAPGERDNFDVIYGTSYHVIQETPEIVEVSFVRPHVSDKKPGMIPLNIEKRFILLRGNSGFYSYAIYERPSGWPDFNLNQTRITFKLQKDKFHYMAVSDSKQRFMPSPDDLLPPFSEKLAYPEATKLKTPKNASFQGEVDDKYQYSCDNRENRVHGWISMQPLVGFWVITASDEFRNGGILKQNLTSHIGPTCLSMFHSAHYAGEPLCAQFRQGEAWTKVFGPVLIYLNSLPPGHHYSALWNDAKRKMFSEVAAWPYSWPESPDYPKAWERGSVSGRLLVEDKFHTPVNMSGKYAFLGLALPGEAGSWQMESKGYQFWAQANAEGFFNIRGIRAGEYNLYGWVPGVLGDYKFEASITISPGLDVNLGEILFHPPRQGKTIWKIGIPDRSASEFFIPEPNPSYINKLFVNHPERYRQYGLWERYSELYPTTDLVYTVGASDWRRDWFFAHTCRICEDGTLQPTTWQVKFILDKVILTGDYRFQLALAAASNAAIQVRFNDPSISRPHFDTMQTGKDNAIARHGIHGLYHLFSVAVSPRLLCDGENILYLTQRKATSIFTGVMYDYLRLEEPSS